MVKVECKVAYNDLQLNRLVNVGEVLEVTSDRAKTLENLELVKVLEEMPEPKVQEPEVEEVKHDFIKPVPKKRRK